MSRSVRVKSSAARERGLGEEMQRPRTSLYEVEVSMPVSAGEASLEATLDGAHDFKTLEQKGTCQGEVGRDLTEK